jgi:hypothetical protein
MLSSFANGEKLHRFLSAYLMFLLGVDDSTEI